ncbi:MAG: MarR family winged helix-turn-helix transcriptional regulator [Balneolaceae bacterium]
MEDLSGNIYINSNAIARLTSAAADNKIRPFGFTASYAFVIMAVERSPGIGQKEIGSMFHLAPSTVTRFIDKLEKKGLLKRRQNGKSVSVELTQRGKKLAGEIDRSVQDIEKELSDKMGDKYMKTLNQMMQHGIILLSQTENKQGNS